LGAAFGPLAGVGRYAGQATWAVPGYAGAKDNMTVMITCARPEGIDEHYAYHQAAARQASYKLAGALHVLVCLFAVMLIFKNIRDKKCCTWTVFVLCVEGLLSSTFRAWKGFNAPLMFNANFDVFFFLLVGEFRCTF